MKWLAIPLGLRHSLFDIRYWVEYCGRKKEASRLAPAAHGAVATPKIADRQSITFLAYLGLCSPCDNPKELQEIPWPITPSWPAWLLIRSWPAPPICCNA